MSAVRERPVEQIGFTRRNAEAPVRRRTDIQRQTTQTKRIPEPPETPEVEAVDEIDNAVIKAIHAKRHRKKAKAGLVVKVLVVFVLGLLVVFRYASITDLGYRVSDAKTEYEKIVGENDRLSAKIESQMNIEELTQEAKERFDMQRAQTHQMVVLDVKPLDQTEVYEYEIKETEQDNRAWYVKIYDAARSFLGLV